MNTPIPFRREMEFTYGEPDPVSPLIRRVVAPNPDPFTLYGTNTYLVGRGRVAVIDPGPDLEPHLDALLRAVDGETVTHILVTHTHLDHSPLARPLADRTGATVCGFGPHGSAGPPLPVGDGIVIDEGGDLEFEPDLTLRHSDRISGPGWELEAIHTPGHTSNHLCFALPAEQALLTGDHVMGWATSIVIPPDGEMAAYRASVRMMLARGDATLWPGHGPAITNPAVYLAALLDHRAEREAEILACLRAGPTRIGDMVPVIYADVDPGLHPAAGLSVLAHLIELIEAGRVACAGEPGLGSEYSLG